MADDKMVLTVVLSLQLAARIDAAARASGRTRANYVRLLLEQTHDTNPETKHKKVIEK